MQTFIELYLLAYFTLTLFTMLAVRFYIKSKANIFSIVFASVMLSIICFIMDFYLVPLIYRILIVCLYIVIANLVIHQLKHISKLILCSVVCTVYYVAVIGINYFVFELFNKTIYKTSNYYLSMIIGINFIVFTLFNIVIRYLQTKKHFELTQSCLLQIKSSKIKIVGFLDTGNRLKDIKTGLPVVIVNLSAVKKHLTSQMYADILFATNSSGQFADVHKLKYTTVAGTNFMTVFKPSLFMVNGKKIDCYIGISIKNIVKEDALLNLACV